MKTPIFKIALFSVVALVAGVVYLRDTDSACAAQWGPNCPGADSTHKRCPDDGPFPYTSIQCVDSVDLRGTVRVFGLKPELGSVAVTVQAGAPQCDSYVQCLKRGDTKQITINPADNKKELPWLIDTLGCSGGNCNDQVYVSHSVNKGKYKQCDIDPYQGHYVSLAGKNRGVVPVPVLNVTCYPPDAEPPPPKEPPPPPKQPPGEQCPYECLPYSSVGNVCDGGVYKNTGKVSCPGVGYCLKCEPTPTPEISCPGTCLVGDRTGQSCDLLPGKGAWQNKSGSYNCPVAAPNCHVCEPTPTPDTPPGNPDNTPTGVPPGVPNTPVPPLTDTPPDSPENTPTDIPPGVPQDTPTPVPPTAPPTPTVDLENACECDSLDLDQPILGQPLHVTAYSKVVGDNAGRASIQSMEFKLFKGVTTGGNRPQRVAASREPVKVIENSAGLVRYQSEWTVNPALEAGEEYRLQAVPECVERTAFLSGASAVLGESSARVGFFGRIANFFTGLFGSGNEEVRVVEEDEGLFAPIANLFKSSGDSKGSIQLDRFQPAYMEKERCNIIKFEFQ